ncbi:MAG: protein kinase [Deltaproteobacteria bacterium]|nr:protein kinase [Deltaproteobacteria bacterium]
MPPKEGESAASTEAAPFSGNLSALLQEIARAPGDVSGSAWEQELHPGAVIGGRFELVREVGRGGFGVVYEARDRQLGRAVAFKAVRAGGKAALREERLQREAEAAARLSHPNIVTLHDMGRCEHGPFLVLELLRGQTLGERLEQGPLARAEALRIAVEISEALAHAHGQGVVHRDLTPGNVFLCEDGRVKVLDFGLAHAFGRRRSAGGTPAYMAPEQWRGAPEDERTDVFALGVLLFKMLAGSLPFPDDDQGREVTGPDRAPGLSIPDAPAVAALVARMLAKDPVQRPRDGAEVRDALVTFARELQRTPSSGSAPVLARPRRRIGLKLALAAALMALAVVGGALLWTLREGAARTPVAVAVADFANQTGEPELDGLSGMLITSLEQSRRLSVLTRVRMLDVLRQLGKANVAVVDEALGREVALSAGVRALVLATIRRFDQLYAIELKVLDPVQSEYLFTLQEQGTGKASVPGMIDRLSEQTRRRLRESPAEVAASRVKVGDATTQSFTAYQHYFRGDQLKEAIRYEAAIAEYQQAIALDPTFALPHYRIAYLGEFVHLGAAEQRAHMEAALRHVDRVPPKERMLFQAWQAHMEKRDPDAQALYARLAEAYPQDKEVLFLAGDLLLHQERYQEALPFFERAVVLDPSWEPALMHVTDSLAGLGRTGDALAHARRWVERGPSGTAYRMLAMAESMSGNPGLAVDAARRALDLDGTAHSRERLAEMLLNAGRFEEAEATVRPFVGPGASRLERAFSLRSLALALTLQGRLAEALRALDDGPPVGEELRLKGRMARVDVLAADERRHPEALREVQAVAGAPEAHGWGLALPLVLLGDLEGAARLAPGLKTEAERAVYQALVAWKGGQRQRAAEQARALAHRPGPHRAVALWLSVRLASEEQRDAEVVAAAAALRAEPGAITRAWAYPEAVVFEAEALARLGKRAEARERLAPLLRAWHRADPGIPVIERARALGKRLGA